MFGVFKSINVPTIEEFGKNLQFLRQFYYEQQIAIHEFIIFCETIWIERLKMSIYFGRFDSEMSDLRKTHTNSHSLEHAR